MVQMTKEMPSTNHVMNMEQKAEETDNTTKNLVHEILRECNEHQLEISENFCTYYVKLLMLDPHWKISPEKKINRTYIQLLVSFVIKKFQLKESPSLATLRIQQVFRSQCVKKEVVVKNFRDVLVSLLEPLFENVLNYVPDENNKPRLFRRINILLSFGSLIGHWKNMPTILKDNAMALKSIMDDRELVEFIEMKPEARLSQLLYYQHIVMGIRLFHHDAGRQLSDFQDLPKIITRDIEHAQVELVSQLRTAMERVNMATTAIENVYEHKYKVDKNNPDQMVFCMKMRLPEGVTVDDVHNTFEFLTLARQYEVYIRRIIYELNDCENEMKSLSKNHRGLLTKLNNTIKFNIGIAATTVFPIFSELANTWVKIQNQFLILAVYLQLFQKLVTIFSNEVCNKELWKIIIGNEPIMTNTIRKMKNKGILIKGPLKNCELLQSAEYTKMDHESFEFLGFCVWTLVQTKGALIPGNPQMGVLKWRGKFFVFAVIEAALIFDENPEKLIKASLETIRKKPELINLLKVYDLIYEVRNVDVLFQKVIPAKKIMNCSTQTIVHPVPSAIDPNYIMNEWDLYRDAEHLASLSKCSTHSAQTLASHYRCPTFVQTTEPRDKGCQTKTDNFTNVEIRSNFIFGLRGRKDNVQHTVELTRPINENEYHTCATTSENAPVFAVQPHKCPKNIVKRKKKTSKTEIESFQFCFDGKNQLNNSEIVEDLNSCLCVSGLLD